MTADVLIGHENETIEGAYRLGKLLEASSEAAVYRTEQGERALPASIELRGGDTPDAAHRLAAWREELALSHPNLIRLYAAGSSTLDGIPVIYLVMERADESLAGVLAERVLSDEEAREMAEPALSALSYLHKKGYCFGSLEPSQILASGDTLKLASGDLRRSGDGGSAEEDMWAFGAVLAQALTLATPKRGEDAGPYLRGISEPLSGIVRHCLDHDPAKRWTAEQAVTHLHHPKQTTHKQTVPEQTTPAYVMPHRKLIFGLAAALLLVALAAVLTRRSDRAPAPVAPVRPAVSTPERAPQVLPPVEAQPTAREKTGPKPTDRRASGWAVVVASYNAKSPAEKRAREMEKRWPGFKAEVFEPASAKNRHLVVLGTNLSEDAADALRTRALASGLPRDTYIKRLGQ